MGKTFPLHYLELDFVKQIPWLKLDDDSCSPVPQLKAQTFLNLRHELTSFIVKLKLDLIAKMRRSIERFDENQAARSA